MQLFEIDPPKNWQEFVSLKDKLSCCSPESVRFSDDLTFYRQYTKQTPREIRFKIIYDFIGDNQTKIVRNNFPYLKLIQNLGKVTHYCLWSKIGPLSNEQIESEIKKNFLGKISLYFENIDAIKSIPEIWHCHIFIKED